MPLQLSFLLPLFPSPFQGQPKINIQKLQTIESAEACKHRPRQQGTSEFLKKK